MDAHFPILLARGGNGFLIILGIAWCVGAIIWYGLRWINNPQKEWKNLTPNTKDTILGFIVFCVLIGIFCLLSKK
jgi:hypothetical protein